MYYFSYHSATSFQFVYGIVCVSVDPELVSAEIVNVSGAFANGFLNGSFPFPARDPV